MPLPFRRKVFPDWVPAGILSLCGPSSVGTSTVAPSAACAKEIGTSQTTSVSSRWKMGCSRTWIDHVEVAGLAAGRRRRLPFAARA